MEEKIDEVLEEQAALPRALPAVKGTRAITPLDPLTAYLNEIRKYEYLTPEEEFELAARYRKTDDPAAAYRLITSNLNLVVKIALTFKREWQNLMDLIQEGNVGLMKAVKNFDPLRGVRLPAYASWWIKAYILKYILDNWRLVRVGTTNTRRKLLYNLRREKENLERQGFVPSTKLLAAHFNVEEREIIDVEASLGAADVSVDAPLGDDENAPTLLQQMSDGTSTEAEMEREQLRHAVREKLDRFLATAKPIERDLVELRILADPPLPLQEIGSKYGVTREAVRQSEQRLMKKLKVYLAEHG
jgi:RNA polymerase sigma-32 factor